MIDDRSLQAALKAKGFYAGDIDGLIGPASRAAIRASVLARVASTPIAGWSDKRLRVAAEQAILVDLSFYPPDDIDGLIGPDTRDAWERWQNALRDRQVTPAVAQIAAPTPRPTAPAAVGNAWPTQAGVNAFYGEVGSRQTALALPYPMRLAWDKAKTVRTMTLHQRVAPSACRVLARALEHYGETKIRELGLDLFGGSLAVRKMRGGSAWSMHSWGIAIDFDPERNQLRWGRDRARLAKADAAKFWEFWEAEGWVSLGRARNYDWMHVQAARL